MPLLKAAILPPSPLLIPEIGKANTTLLDKTLQAYQKIAEDFQALAIETVIIISPHQPLTDKLITINVAPELELNFQEFGLINKKITIPGDSLLADQLHSGLDLESMDLISDSHLNHGSAIPLYLFKSLGLELKLVSLTLDQSLPLDSALELGKKLAALLKDNDKKVALIASGQLSHRLKKKSPGGYSPKGTKFDNYLIKYLNSPDQAIDNILKMDRHLISEAGESGLLSIMTLLGAVESLDPEVNTLAYQTNFGVGYLSLDFTFSQLYEPLETSD